MTTRVFATPRPMRHTAVTGRADTDCVKLIKSDGAGERSGIHPTVQTAAACPTSNQIAARAHDLFVAGGRHVTRIGEYWLRAEQELLDQAARRLCVDMSRKGKTRATDYS